MTLLGALDDFLTTTLAAVPGFFGKLEYVSGLKGMTGYSHWGMSKVHGEEAANQALADAHSLVLSEILRCPLRKLKEDAETASRQEEIAEYLKKLRARSADLLPFQAGGGATRHLSSVLHALSVLEQYQPSATRPVA